MKKDKRTRRNLYLADGLMKRLNKLALREKRSVSNLIEIKMAEICEKEGC